MAEKSRNWKKRIVVGMILLFLYLGTGYQFALYNWELYHSPSYENFRVNDKMGKMVFETLWPIAARGQTKKQKAEKEENPVVSYVTKNSYVKKMTFFWGFKIIWNLVFIAVFLFADILAMSGVIIYSLIKFLLTLVFSPFGINVSI